MGGSKEGSIVVRVEVEIPEGTGSARLAHGHLLGAGPCAKRLMFTGTCSATITLPAPPTSGSTTARVRGASGSGGTICARGTLSNTVSTSATVVARVYGNVSLSSTQVPAVPPLNDAQVRSITVPEGTTSWEFSRTQNGELPGAACGAVSPLPPNTLVIWVTCGDGCYATASVPFLGLCSSTTDCDASGPVNFQLAHRLESEAPVLRATVTHATGDFKDLPKEILLAKDRGRAQWSPYQPIPEALHFAVVGADGAMGYQLKGSGFNPALVSPGPESTPEPLQLVFKVAGRGDRAGCKGSCSILITE